MVKREDVESLLLKAGLRAEEVDEGMWVARSADEEGVALVVHYSPPVLVFRLKVMDLPQDAEACSGLFRRLLELNASDLVHAAYGLEENDVILTEALELENLDENEFQAVIDAFQMAVATHMELLSPFRAC